MTKKKLLLIDGDQILYQITSAAEYEHTVQGDEFPDAWMFEGQVALMSDKTEVIKTLDTKLKNITRGWDKYIVCFTSTPNFRHERLSSYKGGRLKKRKPLCYWPLVHQLVEGDNTKKYDGLEADDVMSIIATHPDYLRRYDMAIYSNDKDMMQVPDTIIIGDSVKKGCDLVTANHWRYTQCLTGDRTDGYLGLPGWGPKKAQKYLDAVYGLDEDVYVDAVISAYTDAGLTVDDALRQIDCACILRYAEYDTKNKRPILIGERHDT